MKCRSVSGDVLQLLADRRRALGLTRDLVGIRQPRKVAEQAALEVRRLAAEFRAGRMTMAEVRAELRGAA